MRYDMHPEMKRLALEAGGSTYPEVNTEQLVKYTELVVKECTDLVVRNPQFSGYSLCDRIKEHFGVK